MICPTPGCGYRLKLFAGPIAPGLPAYHECDRCLGIWFYQPAGIDEDGPHADRLLRVYDVPPGR